MSADAWIAVGASLVAIVGAMATWAKFMVRAPLEARVAQVEAEKAATEAERAQADIAKAAAERGWELERRSLGDLDSKYRSLQQDFVNFRLGETGVPLKLDIEAVQTEAMDALDVEESSILVPGPPPHSGSFVFLLVTGPAAAKLRRAKLPLDEGIVGRVFASGAPHRTTNPYADPNFFPGIDRKGEHQTQTMLTVALSNRGQTIGVAQFLNKVEGFSESDETKAQEFADLLAPKVAAFVRDPANFELLGLAGRSDDQVATIAFCDLTSSSSLLQKMNVPNAIDCINEYLEQQCDIALRFGATVDKYLGDGAMLRFNLRPTGDDHLVQAVDAALAMRDAFFRLKQGWISEGLPVADIYSRIGISSGTVYEGKIGHPQFRQITVVGDAVNEAANLCESGTRADDVILVPRHLGNRLADRFELEEVEIDNAAQAFEVVSTRPTDPA